jgi:PAS domain S-box-containing protein
MNNHINIEKLLGTNHASDLLIDSMNMLVVILDTDYNIVYFNQQAEKTLGYTQERIKGQSWFDLIVHQPDHSKVKAHLDEIYAHGGNLKSEWVAVTRNGDNRNIRWRLSGIIEDNKITGALYLGVDITQTINIEKALEQSEQRFQFIFNNINDAVFVQDSQSGTILDVNQRACELFKYEKDELKKLTIVDLTPNTKEYSMERAFEKLKKATEGESLLFEWPAKDKYGRIFWVEVNMKQALVAEHRIILVTARDISARKEAEEKISQHHRFFETLIQRAPFGTFIYELQDDNQLVFIEANESANKILGIDCSQFIGITIEEAFPALAQTNIPDQYRHVAATGDYFETEIVDYNEQGITGAYQIYTSQLGKNRMVVFFNDITEHKKAEQAVKESQERAQAFADATYEGIVILDNGIIIDANAQFVKMFRYQSLDEITGMAGVNLSAPESKLLVAEYIQQNSTDIYQVQTFCKDGYSFPAEIRGKVFTYKGKTLRIIAVRDITERKRNEHELENKNRELEQIVYVTSHDLRSPLVNVQGYSKEVTYLIEDIKKYLTEIPQIPETIKSNLEAILNKDIPEAFYFINSSIIKMDSLLQGLLRLSRSGRMQLNTTKINVNQLLIDVISALEYSIKSQNIQIVINELPPCHADANMLNQVFSNLIDNAIKYRSPLRNCTITLSGKRHGSVNTYCIEDNGLGIASEHTEKIFEIFYRLNPKETPGEGLGLSIVHKILLRMHGDIRLESILGQGSKFYISLPA